MHAPSASVYSAISKPHAENFPRGIFQYCWAAENRTKVKKLQAYKLLHGGSCLDGTPTLKLSHVRPHPRAGRAPDIFLPHFVGSFAVGGGGHQPSEERPKDPALVFWPADICTRPCAQRPAPF